MKKIILILSILLISTVCYSLENWQIKAVENDLLDYVSWANNAVSMNVYQSTENALEYKSFQCAERMIFLYEGSNGELIDMTISEKVNFIHDQPGYMNRVEREL